MERRFINVEDLSKYLGVKKATVYSWVSQKSIPYLKIGRLVKFDLRDIEKWLEGRKVCEYMY